MSSPTYEVTFQTSDNETLAVDWEAFRKFGIYSPQDDPDARPRDPIPLPNIDSVTLKKVVEYCLHTGETTPEEFDPLYDDPPRKQKIGEWESKFMQVDDKMRFDIILAANYLDIKPLLELGTKSVAESIKGKTPTEIGRMFNLVNDFTPEEEAQIRRENQWAGDR
ncbi:Skp1 family, dimerization domain-containing protein [Rhizoctonia solani]|nr:Skp1 family, dimerization domain-containing protein [Rhizoctonia solani]